MNNLKVLDTLQFGFSNPETFTHPNPHPVILRGAEWRSRRIHPPKIILVLRERVDVEDVGEGQTRTLPNTLDLLYGAHIPK